MRKFRRIVSISIMAAMLLSTMGIGAFAATDVDVEAQGTPEEEQTVEVMEASITDLTATPGDGSVSLSWSAVEADSFNVYYKEATAVEYAEEAYAEGVSETTCEVTGLTNDVEYSFKVESVDKSVSAETTATPKAKAEPGPGITGLQSFSGYKCIHLEWPKVDGAEKYIVYRNGAVWNDNVAATNDSIQKFKNANSIKENVDYSFSVTYMKDGVESEQSNIVADQCVRPMYIYVTLKKTRTLKSHDGTKTKRKFKKGTRIATSGFNTGRYTFYTDDGHYFMVSKISTKKRSANYWPGAQNYSQKEATYFVNDTGKSSSTGNLIWVSQMSQHVYVFSGSAGNWNFIRDWECATGKANSPSPTSMSKKIGKKFKKRHGLPTWSCYSGLNAFHGKLTKWKVGKPASGGCIRNENPNAQFIYKSIPKKTRVLMF